ncbi:hypothetical protein [Mycolicibacterium lutetiense]|uniref:Uncharacterized protein n=1 Tax=Mycolicibacterium lutetiense TaxID=1641992 RepID=A0ABS5A0B5_9MYCO|nr:hypothetical protein [Mycolicibacterium lutetiense]MBP2455189.1 hypothetical protein [Mycolicibacterium lutetiense]
MSDNTIQIPVIEPIDGTVYITDVYHDEGLVYVTIAGPHKDQPVIIMFDREDLQAIETAHEDLKRELRPRALDFFNTTKGEPDPNPAAVLDILNAPKRNGRFIHDRVEYRYDTGRTEWVAWGRTDIDDQDGAW